MGISRFAVGERWRSAKSQISGRARLPPSRNGDLNTAQQELRPPLFAFLNDFAIFLVENTKQRAVEEKRKEKRG
jgi:hypothetical protein